MDATLAPVVRKVPVRGLELAIREWPGEKRSLLLVHGLASNARTWDAVAEYLNARGHHVVSLDQRGHGQSDKPDDGYDFASVTSDLRELIDTLSLTQPVVAGQSWGGNVVLEFAARYPDVASGVVLVDGGFIELAHGGRDWETVSAAMKPPMLIGTPRVQMLERFRSYHPDWSEAGIENTLANYESMPDGTIRPWLTLDRHMSILRALWEQKPSELGPRVQAPTLIAVAAHPATDLERRRLREEEIARLESTLARVRTRVFDDSSHDIHVHQPEALAGWILQAFTDGFFADAG